MLLLTEVATYSDGVRSGKSVEVEFDRRFVSFDTVLATLTEGLDAEAAKVVARNLSRAEAEVQVDLPRKRGRQGFIGALNQGLDLWSRGAERRANNPTATKQTRLLACSTYIMTAGKPELVQEYVKLQPTPDKLTAWLESDVWPLTPEYAALAR